MKTLNKQDLEYIINGAALLGSGGGGAASTAQQLLDNFSGTVQCTNTEEIIDDTDHYAAMTAYLGSPDSMTRLHKPDGAVHAIRVLDQISADPSALAILNQLDQSKPLDKIRYILPAEVGPLNSVTACMVAQELGLAVVDADGAGRAVPELPMITYAHVPGIKPAPAILANVKPDNTKVAVSLHLDSPEAVERYARPIVAMEDYRELAGLAMWTMNGKPMDQAVAVRGTLTLARALGEVLAQPDAAPAERACDCLRTQGFEQAEVVFSGRIKARESEAGVGFDNGRVIFEGTESDEQVLVYFKNENLIAWSTAQAAPLAMGPDLICYVTARGRAFTNADIEERGGHFVIGDEVDPLVSILVVSPHPGLKAFPYWDNMKRAYAEMLRDMGYPLPYMPYVGR